MSRVIKFRQPVFRTENGSFIKFHYWGYILDNFIAPKGTKSINGKFAGEKSEQFTGLKDRNGVEIYKDDILKFPNQTIGIVVWDDASFAIKSPGSNAVDYEHSSVFERAVVIGNIHQNPELLNPESAES